MAQSTYEKAGKIRSKIFEQKFQFFPIDLLSRIFLLIYFIAKLIVSIFL